MYNKQVTQLQTKLINTQSKQKKDKIISKLEKRRLTVKEKASKVEA